MTQAEANTLAGDYNTELGGLSATVKYGAYPYWKVDLTKEYNVTLYPTTHDAAYGLATESEQIAFARVSRKTTAYIAINDPEATAVTWAARFDIIGASDAELAAYLGL